MKAIILSIVTLLMIGCFAEEHHPPVVETVPELISTVKLRYASGSIDTLIVHHRTELCLSFESLQEIPNLHNEITRYNTITYANGVKSFSILSRTINKTK